MCITRIEIICFTTRNSIENTIHKNKIQNLSFKKQIERESNTKNKSIFIISATETFFFFASGIHFPIDEKLYSSSFIFVCLKMGENDWYNFAVFFIWRFSYILVVVFSVGCFWTFLWFEQSWSCGNSSDQPSKFKRIPPCFCWKAFGFVCMKHWKKSDDNEKWTQNGGNGELLSFRKKGDFSSGGKIQWMENCIIYIYILFAYSFIHILQNKQGFYVVSGWQLQSKRK